MALDPAISLEVRPPQFNLQIPQPLQQFGQVLNLQNLMQQQQLFPLELQAKQLGLAQAQADWEERQRLNKLIFGGQLNALESATPQAIAQPGAVQPTAPAIAPVQQPVPDLTYPSFPSVAGAPPAATPAVTPAAAASIPSLAALMAAPTPPVTAAPPAEARPTGQIQMPAGIPIPDFGQWFQVAPNLGPKIADSYAKSIKSIYDMHDAQFKDQQNNLKRAAGLANSIVDEPTKMAAIGTAFNEHIISPEERDRLLGVKFDDPIWKSWQQGALTGAEGLQSARDDMRLHMEQVSKAIELAQAPYKIRETVAAATKAETEADVAQRNADASKLIAAASQGPEQLQTAFAALPKDRQTPFAGANTAEEIYYRMHPEQRPEVGAAKAGAEDLARKNAEMQFYAPTTAQVLSGKIRLQDVDPAIQKIIAPALIEGGYGQKGSPTEAAGSPFAKLISDAERERLADYGRSVTVLDNTLGRINGTFTNLMGTIPNENLMGPLAGQTAHLPWEVEGKVLRSDLVAQQQQLKKFITNGSLRGLTTEKLDEMFPTITTLPSVARQQIAHMRDMIIAERNQYLRDLGDKVIPSVITGPAQPAAAPAETKPTYQTIEKTGTPGGKVTGTFTIGGAVAAPPGKIMVQAPAARGGGKFWLDSDKWPQYQKQGFTRAE